MSETEYNSIGAIHEALRNKELRPEEAYRYIDDNYEEIPGSENDYHNISVEFSRQNGDKFAAAVSHIGLKTYPFSPDLLADAIKYSQEIGDIKSCQELIETLGDLDVSYWKWRTFVFVIDFLKDSLGYSKNTKQYKENLDKAKDFIAEFKRVIPHEERAYVAEAELYENQNDIDNAIKALKGGIKKVVVAPQCCMKLADIYLELGKYADVEEMAKKGILASIQDQPTVSVGYLYYLLALSLDAQRIIRKSSEEKTPMNESEIVEIFKAYVTAERLFVNEGRPTVSYIKTIKAKLIMLEMEEGIGLNASGKSLSSEYDEDEEDDERIAH